MRKSALVIVLVLLFALPACAAQAGVLRTEDSAYWGQWVVYEVGHGPGSLILARTLSNGQLALTDRSTPIVLATPDSPLRCHLRDRRHTAICGEPNNSLLSEVKIVGGAHNDLIDARGLEAGSVDLEGGAGNDTLLAPRNSPYPRRTTLVGGPGHNVFVGGPGAEVSYAGARGPVRVDLARGIGSARGEWDRLIDVKSVIGSQRAWNSLSGSGRGGGLIVGGGEGNRIVTRSSGTMVRIASEGRRDDGAPSTISCLRPSRVLDPAPTDVLTGHCRVQNMTLHLPMRSVASAPLTLEPTSGDHGVRVVLSAGSVIVAEAHSSHRSVACPLNAQGRELLRRERHLSVLVSEYQAWPGSGETPHPSSSFTTVLRLRRAKAGR